VSSKTTMYSPEDPASSSSDQGTVEKTRMIQSTYQSDGSEQSESGSESGLKRYKFLHLADKFLHF